MLLEVNTLNELINYFEGLQNPNVSFELKGVHINEKLLQQCMHSRNRLLWIVHINEKQCDMTDISDQQLSAVPLKANYADAETTTIHIHLL